MATSPDVVTLSYNAQNFISTSGDKRQPTFLFLAPTTSASYPTTPNSKPVAATAAAGTASQSSILAPPALVEPVVASALVEALPVIPAPTNLSAIDIGLKTRRSSSLSSDGSGSARKKGFLRLGPMHFGDRDSGDWSEVAAE